MKCDFKAAKAMAHSVALRFGHGCVNYSETCGYYVTSCFTNNTIGLVSKAGRFTTCMQKNSLSVWKR